MTIMPNKVLLVEDEMLIAMEMEEILTELGFEVVGPAMRLKRAVELAQSQEIDLALLDVNLAGEKSFPVARLLKDRNVPFAFVTGYGAAGLSEEFRDTPVLQKPVEKHQVATAINAICCRA